MAHSDWLMVRFGVPSLVTMLKRMSTTPPTSICAELDMSPAGSEICWLHAEPSAQNMGARSNAIAPMGLAQTPLPKFKSKTPEKPKPRPNHSIRVGLSLIHISEPTRLGMISYAVFCLKKKKNEIE